MMIEQSYVDHTERGFNALRDEFVRLARFGDSGGMIVRDDDCRAIPAQRLFHDLARMNAGALRLAFSGCL
jgi:hypothetical protein